MDVLRAVSRSAAIILSKQLNKNLLYYFSSAEIILIVTCMHSLMSTVKSMQGFKASLHVMQELVQSLMIQALGMYIASGDYALVNIVLLISVLEFLPAIKGWVGADLASFEASVNYIFADKINHLKIDHRAVPYLGVLGVAFRGEGLLSKTFVFTGITSLSNIAYEAVHGSTDLSIAWPIFLLYFVYEIMGCSKIKDEWESFFQFGLYRASDAIYQQILKGGNLMAVAVTFTLLSSLNPSDKVWTGVTILVLVQCVSNSILETVILLCRTDPFLAGMGVVTVVHFSSMALEAFAKIKASPQSQ
jgi:hypothetical protein